jgi:integration host factor subunit alpha
VPGYNWQTDQPNLALKRIGYKAGLPLSFSLDFIYLQLIKNVINFPNSTPSEKRGISMTLTKEHLIAAAHDKVGYSKSKSSTLIESLLEIIKKTLENGQDVLISGFGKFCVKQKNSRKGRNPQTEENLTLEARRVVTFRCSKALKDKINGEG